MEIYENLDINDLDGEIWKVITNFPDYYASNIGRVKSFKQDKVNGKILRQIESKDCYFRVHLYKNGKRKTKKVHRLVYETFKEKLKKGYIVHHINDDKKDNFIDNLKSIPKEEHDNNKSKKIKKIMSENKKGKNHPMFGKKHSEKTKNMMIKNHANFKGENNPNFGKGISNEKITDIKTDIKLGNLSQIKIAKKHNVSQSFVSNIKTNLIK